MEAPEPCPTLLFDSLVHSHTEATFLVLYRHKPCLDELKRSALVRVAVAEGDSYHRLRFSTVLGKAKGKSIRASCAKECLSS